MTTTKTTRYSVRLLQNNSGENNNNIVSSPTSSPPKKKVKSPPTKVPTTPKTTTAKKKIKVAADNTPNAPIASSNALSEMDNDDTQKPWYTFFTNSDPEYDHYMATEWGFEQPYSDQHLFEKLSLEGAQAGLTWRTILCKRDAYRRVFHNFDPVIVALMTEQDIERILQEQPVDPKNTRTVIVRHRGKIESVIHNAKCILKMREEHNSNISTSNTDNIFAQYLWSFVDHKPILYINRNKSNYASTSVESMAMSQALKKQFDFKFVGPTTCYSLMQATGMVIDHPYNTPEWKMAYERLQKRPGGYQERILE